MHFVILESLGFEMPMVSAELQSVEAVLYQLSNFATLLISNEKSQPFGGKRCGLILVEIGECEFISCFLQF